MATVAPPATPTAATAPASNSNENANASASSSSSHSTSTSTGYPKVLKYRTPAEHKLVWDLSPVNWYHNARIYAAGASLRNIVDAVSIPYHYRRYASDRHSVYLQLGHYPDGRPIPTLRVLIYLPKIWADEAAVNVAIKAREGRPLDEGEEEKCRTKGVLVHIAGGGFTMCRPENEGHLCRTLCDSLGCIVISPDYLKAPQNPYPAALDQVYALLQWIANPKDGLTEFLEREGTPSSKVYVPLVDVTKIALSGGSSGGNLAAAICVRAVQERLILPGQAKIVGLALDYAMLDMSVPYGDKLEKVPDKSKVLPRWLTRLFLDGYLQGKRIPERTGELLDPLLSPGQAPIEVLRQFPRRIAVVIAENDYLAEENKVFVRRLVEEAGYVEGKTLFSKVFEEVGHGFDLTPHMTAKAEAMKGPARDEAWALIARALDGVL